jgi:AraC-like DNA-binding protein
MRLARATVHPEPTGLAMQFRSYIPRAPLCEFVDDFWQYEDYVGDHARERILPSGTFEMVFNLQEDELRIYGSSQPDELRRFSGAVVSGPYREAFMSDAAEEAAILGVHFKPGGAFAVLGMPAHELCNTHIDLGAIWGRTANELRERLCALRDPVERFQLVEQALLQRLSNSLDRHGAVRVGLEVLTRSRGRTKVRDIAKAVDLSQRRFIELFAGEVGVTPKLFSRLQRFQYALACARRVADVDWAQLAVECGYFDQSHLIHEFREFSGVSPSDFWRRQNRLASAGLHVKRNHLPVAS